MAVRNDFAAGEVLAAADLNDTFASKQADVMTTKGDIAAYGTAVDRLAVGTNGQVLTADSGETLGVKWADAGGLVLLEHAALTGSAVSIDNVFTSTYRAYRVIAHVSATSNNAFPFVRVRASGSDLSTSTYLRQELSGSGASAGAVESTVASIGFGTSVNDDEASAVWDVIDIAETKRTVFLGLYYSTNGVVVQRQIVDNTTAYDGLSVIMSAGTFTDGFVSIYGYLES